MISSLFLPLTLVVIAGAQIPTCAELQRSADDRLERFSPPSDRGTEFEGSVYKALKALITDCHDSSLSPKYKEQFDKISEHRAESQLLIAKFYIRKNREDPQRFHLTGAISRLRSIRDEYTQFSRKDEVLYLLGSLYFKEKKLDESQQYFRELEDNYPNSSRATAGVRYLSEIDAARLRQ